EPSPEADRRTLVRRLFFDLLGLPPTPAEVESFVRDPSETAYETLVDRLLASPRHGERWARHWLDVVHYGDTHGFDKDKVRPNAWPYRDYVVRAFNEDRPYARFAGEQLAGDVLYPDDPDGIVATGFIAAGPWDFVGHVELREGTLDKDITRNLDRDDMVSTAMSTFASVTAHCARCHDHKFDPIPQEEYYALQAVFAGVDRADRPYDPDPDVHRRRVRLDAERRALAMEQARLGEVVRRLDDRELREMDERREGLRKELETLSGPVSRLPSSSLGYHSSITDSPDVTKWVQVDLGRSVPLRRLILVPAHVEYGGHPGPGFGFPRRFRVEVSDDPGFSRRRLLADHTGVDFPDPGDTPVGIDARGETARYVRVTATRLWKRTGDWIFALSELVALSGGENVAEGKDVTALDSIESHPHWARQNLVDGFDSRSSLRAPSSKLHNGYHSAIEAGRDVTKWVQVDLGEERRIDGVRLVPAMPTDYPDTPGFGFPVRWRLDVSNHPGFAERRTIFDATGRDFPNPGNRPPVIWMRETGGIKPRARYVRVTASRLWKRRNDHVFALAELEVHSQGENAARGRPVSALDSIDAGRWHRSYLVDGLGSRGELAQVSAALQEGGRREVLEAQLAELEEARRRRVDSLVDEETTRAMRRVASRLPEVDREIGALPPSHVVYAAASDFKRQGNFTPARQPRPIHVLLRGKVHDKGPPAAPGALSCLEGLEHRFEVDGEREAPRRAAFARWLTRPENGLFWRSIVNRVWHFHFGRGIVDSPNDFGRMGVLPTHPELLDWLAVRFRDEGGSFKKLHRLIVTSSVYRQTSAGRDAAAKLDGGNRFLWRMNRRRLEAEAVRDSVLLVSGAIDLKMGGPAVRHFVFKDDHSPVYDYSRFDPRDQSGFRRSVYRFIVRSVPDPFMECLDSADPSILTPKRNVTLTATQALALLNNPFMVEQARRFADRLRREVSGDLSLQVTRAHELALGRLPDREEEDILAAHARRHGLENVCRLLFNTNEFIFVD
ncbi:MAG: DUF1553 domain-containing protein, partial [Planctomycetota bacterium]|nr:DUF1553 domain-containing protein [Planctomycetota bacterium]